MNNTQEDENEFLRYKINKLEIELKYYKDRNDYLVDKLNCISNSDIYVLEKEHFLKSTKPVPINPDPDLVHYIKKL